MTAVGQHDVGAHIIPRKALGVGDRGGMASGVVEPLHDGPAIVPEPIQLAPATEPTRSSTSSQRERRRRILDATLALAAKGGYEAVRMRAVRRRSIATR